MNRVFIAHAGVVSALGRGLDTLYRGLIKEKNGFSRVNRFSTASYVSDIAGLIPGLSLTKAGAMESAVIELAMGLIRELPHELSQQIKIGRLITASTKGGIDLLRTDSFFATSSDRQNGLPASAARGLPVSSLTANITREIGIKKTGFNISAACASSTIALAKAGELIRSGREHTVAVLAMDLVTEFVFSGFSAIGSMGPGPAMPFDRHRQGLTLGEGAALIVLTSREPLARKHNPAPSEMAGWGIAGDAAHLAAPDKMAAGLKTAILQACKTAKISPERIGIISTHGTGTVYNDAMELKAINDLFPSKAVMANSIKGSIGHTLGASGAIEAALCTKLLEEKTLPGTKGLIDPEQGAVPIFSSRNRTFETTPVLTINSGFGGINAALIFQVLP
ncbi:MAG: beta-ketoacyl synthase N-terminal-like domain-containing protein [Desulfotignum sp.]|nr:beta-ketoacyl synthase N-terminal-like domain-containing protein [Desulfotignum sp.]